MGKRKGWYEAVSLRTRIACCACAVLTTTSAPVVVHAQNVADSAGEAPRIVQGTLIAAGNSPFQLKATFTEGNDPNPVGQVEILWVAPDKWRRKLDADKFSQTLIVNGDKVFEQDSDDYFPVGLNALVTAMVDPKPILDAHRPEDRLTTKANGQSFESGVICFGPNGTLCASGRDGLKEIVGAPGHTITFARYLKFDDMRVARFLTDTVGVGEFLRAEITTLRKLDNPDESLFAVPEPTPKEKQIRSVILPDAEFQTLAIEAPEIIWPQVLDGRTVGTASFYVSIDRTGNVREVRPIRTDNERSNDSARNQIMKWKFRPSVKDGIPVQAEAVLTFPLNTREFGPTDILSDAEVRKLVSNSVDPVFAPGVAPSGTTYSLWAAIDSDGNLIEAIAEQGPPALWKPCYEAIRKWHFSPIMENGQPRPYRAEIKCQVP
jgi:hypothetical protein